MATKKLTAVTIDNTKPQAKRLELPDAGCKGLYLVVQPSGSKGFAVRYRFAGKPRKLTLEPAPGEPPPTLFAPRAMATAALAKVEQGRDPAQQKQEGIETPHDAAATRAPDPDVPLAHAPI